MSLEPIKNKKLARIIARSVSAYTGKKHQVFNTDEGCFIGRKFKNNHKPMRA